MNRERLTQANESLKALLPAIEALTALDAGLLDNDVLYQQIQDVVESLTQHEHAARIIINQMKSAYKARNPLLINAANSRLLQVRNDIQSNQARSKSAVAGYEVRRKKLIADGYAASDIAAILPEPATELAAFTAALEQLNVERAALEAFLSSPFDETLLDGVDLTTELSVEQAKADFKQSGLKAAA